MEWDLLSKAHLIYKEKMFCWKALTIVILRTRELLKIWNYSRKCVTTKLRTWVTKVNTLSVLKEKKVSSLKASELIQYTASWIIEGQMVVDNIMLAICRVVVGPTRVWFFPFCGEKPYFIWGIVCFMYISINSSLQNNRRWSSYGTQFYSPHHKW